jgi:hypothetical protein
MAWDQDGGPEALLQDRMGVVVPGLSLGTAASVLFALLGVWHHPVPALGMFLILCLGPLGGPLSEPLAVIDYSVAGMVAWGCGTALLIGLHPLRPNPVTGVISGLALAYWFLLGFGYTYAGV